MLQAKKGEAPFVAEKYNTALRTLLYIRIMKVLIGLIANRQGIVLPYRTVHKLIPGNLKF